MIRIVLIVLMAVIFPMNTFAGKCCSVPPSMEKDKCLEGDCKNGKGVMLRGDGTKYKGEFKDSMPNGKGVFIYPVKELAKKGSYTFRNSGTYEGDVKQGLKEGQGTFTFPTGTKYVGQFENDQMKKGHLTMSDGTLYEGEFENDMPSGKGSVAFSDGRKYVGEIERNHISGNGEMIFPDGRKYSGSFKRNAMNGQGVMTYPDGRKEEGFFSNDKFIGDKSIGDKVSQSQKENVKAERDTKVNNLPKGNVKIESNAERMRRCAEKVGIGTWQETKDYKEMTPEQFIEQTKRENRFIPLEEIQKQFGNIRP